MLEENWDAVQVFTRCRQDYAAAGMTGRLIAQGFCAREIEAGCRLAGVVRRRWAEVSDQVMRMGSWAAAAINERVSR